MINKSTPDIPLVALVGRPNVGKSTLFNRLVGKKRALVDDLPGVTRDRLFAVTTLFGKPLRVVDTGGLDFTNKHKLAAEVQEQTTLAIKAADLILLVIDAALGIHPLDKEIMRFLKKANKPFWVIANKIDTERHENRLAEMYEIGSAEVFALSAEHGRGFGDLTAALFKALKLAEIPLEEPETATPVKQEWHRGEEITVAVIGKPNAGKSSLINHLLAEDRLLTNELPGTTRDPTDHTLIHKGQPYVFIDTAGIRRKRDIKERLEKITIIKTWQAIDLADVVILVLDGTLRPSEQDARLASMVHEKGKGLVIAANKWDLVENPEWNKAYDAAIHHTLPFIDYVPIIHLSAKTGLRVTKLFKTVLQIQEARYKRITTGELNRFLQKVIAAHQPSVSSKKKPKFYFISQPLVAPPTFIFKTSNTEDIHFSYQRYLSNALRAEYGFVGTPIWLKFRKHNA